MIVRGQLPDSFSSLPDNLIDHVFHSTLEGIMITDDQMNITLVNTAFELHTGYKLEEVRGKTPLILQSGKQDTAFYKKCGKT